MEWILLSDRPYSSQLQVLEINVREYTEGAIKNGLPEKLAIYGTQDEEKQNKNTTQCLLSRSRINCEM
jgi:hypothetical protein